LEGQTIVEERRKDQDREKQGAEFFPRRDGESVSHRKLPAAIPVLG
jgi:hypothetical protein